MKSLLNALINRFRGRSQPGPGKRAPHVHYVRAGYVVSDSSAMPGMTQHFTYGGPDGAPEPGCHFDGETWRGGRAR